MTATPVTCDCLNQCGDDPWLHDGSGRATPCKNRLAELAETKRLADQGTRVHQLMKHYATDSVYDLIEKLHAEVTRLQPGACT